MIEYKIIEKPTIDRLEEVVRAHLNLNWEPIGGMVAYKTLQGRRYAQTVIKRKT